MLDTSKRFAYSEDHEAFRDTVRKVFAEHMTPYLDQHEEEGIVPRSAWKALGEAGMLCPTVAEENGGLGLDFGFNCVIAEELSYLGSSAGFTLQNDITVNYFERLGTEEQKAKYLPGMISGDVITAELFFNDCRVPKDNLLGGEGRGFIHLMEELPQERLSIAVGAQAGAQRAFDEAVKFTKDRKAFGRTVFEFQNTKFVLADLAAKLQVGWAHLDWAIQRHLKGELTTDEASAAKLWHTELQWECCDKSLQLHGGAGYMNEYPIARLWRDARVQRIYGGTNEIMKEVVSRAI